jgi:hypothetical protein
MPDLPNLEQRLAKLDAMDDSGWLDYLRQQQEVRERTTKLKQRRLAAQQKAPERRTLKSQGSWNFGVNK